MLSRSATTTVCLIRCIAAGAAVMLLFPIAGFAADPDQSVIGLPFGDRYVTTGRAPMETFFSVTITDTGANDELPTILTKITLHGDASSQLAPGETTNYTGKDFEWLLESQDVTGNFDTAIIDKSEVAGGMVFELSFEGDPILYVPDGSSRMLTLRARYIGEASGEFPAMVPPTVGRGLYFTADVDNGDFVTDQNSSLLDTGSAGPEFGPFQGLVSRPSIELGLPLPSTIAINDKLSRTVYIEDYYGNILDDYTEPLELIAEYSADFFARSELARTDTPGDGVYEFDLMPARAGEVIDNRLDFANDDKVPGGIISVRFGLASSFYKLNVDLTEVEVLTDANSSIGQFASPSTFDADAGFQTVWNLGVEDEGTTDQLPTALYELAVDVVIGDGCIYDATDFDWRLVTDGLTYDVEVVTPTQIIFRGMPRFPEGILPYALPMVYSREDENFQPLILAQDGEIGAFEIQAATTELNAALDGLAINLSIDTDNTIPFFFNVSETSDTQVGSLLSPGDTIKILQAPVIQVATPFFPADECLGEGEGEGEDEGEGEGEGEGNESHTADQNGDGSIDLSELLRVIQFFNSDGYACADPPESTEDGYAPGPGDASCTAHASDYNPIDFEISLSELLRLIQFFNSGGYNACPNEDPPTEDGYCPGLVHSA